MHRLLSILVLAVAAGIPAGADQAADAVRAQARASYPIQYCIVSGEHLDAGQIVEYIHQEPGRPDRLLRFCCRKCLARFKADPATWLRKLDEAAAKTGKKTDPGPR